MKPKLGDVVECEFLDHGEDCGDPFTFLVWGVISCDARKHYVITSWAYADPKEDRLPHNEKRFTIVKSAILRIQVLK